MYNIKSLGVFTINIEYHFHIFKTKVTKTYRKHVDSNISKLLKKKQQLKQKAYFLFAGIILPRVCDHGIGLKMHRV